MGLHSHRRPGLVRHLAALVWARDDAGERRVVVPRRYDFGPDPYAMYR
ncbi:MAG: hypothetical protein ACYTF9_08450 [Planctomycetota bacterium]